MSSQEHLNELVSKLLKIGEGLEIMAGSCREKVEKLQKSNEELREILGVK